MHKCTTIRIFHSVHSYGYTACALDIKHISINSQYVVQKNLMIIYNLAVCENAEIQKVGYCQKLLVQEEQKCRIDIFFFFFWSSFRKIWCLEQSRTIWSVKDVGPPILVIRITVSDYKVHVCWVIRSTLMAKWYFLPNRWSFYPKWPNSVGI